MNMLNTHTKSLIHISRHSDYKMLTTILTIPGRASYKINKESKPFTGTGTQTGGARFLATHAPHAENTPCTSQGCQ